jgi:outer membrane protein assembly factor BamE
MRNLLILLSLLMSSCGGVTGPLSPYKMDIRQGNYVTAEMRGKLKIGMSKQQVHYLLGTPMISDAFHSNRWDYVYLLEHRGKLVEERRLTLYFVGDNLKNIDEGPQPAEAAPAAKPDNSRPVPAGG